MTLLAVLLALAFAAYVLHLLRVIRDDDRGHAFTHRPPPRSDVPFGAAGSPGILSGGVDG